ncbi:MEDS domain-containing protein [Halomicrobium salinisoli]|uniref:MEDS domain-containing protein n=1 Tax=Halomicrobium salinisoli TaxID=2878391 RepID=UPI001CF0460E|nr:MEDS domain-containing protein [Halomicrobium salinisoli]
MDETAGRGDYGGALSLDSGLAALRSSPEFRGPVESVDGHDCNDHFAHVYETPEEKFEAAVPFVRHGIERGDRVLYVVDESTEADVRAALRAGGVDVDEATAAGALSFHTVQETYLRNETFDVDEMIDFYGDTVAAATEAYEGLRIVAEMTWIAADDTPVEAVMEYEQRINDLFAETDSLAICQYDRERFDPEVVRNVVESHPHLIYDGAACHNVYYTPPEEFFGDDAPARENDRMLRTLRDRTEAKAELADHERFLRELYEVTASQDRTFEEKLRALFELGCERFDLDMGALNRIEPGEDRLVVEHAGGEHSHFEVGSELPLSETYCKAAADIETAVDVCDPEEEGFDDVLVYEEFGVDGYLGTYVPVDGGADRTLAFVPDGTCEGPFSERDRAYLELMGQWVGCELNRRRREQFISDCYEVTSDPALGFEEKLHRLLDLARERMDLEAAGLTHLPEWDGAFRTEYAIGYGEGDGAVDASDGLWTDPGDGCYCRQAIAADGPVGMADVRGTDWADDEIHREHGLSCYLGTKVTNGSTPYGTLWVGSGEPRDRPFSETERTFLELIGQWVSYELERRDHGDAQRELYEVTADPDRSFDEKLDALFDLGREQFGLEVGGLAAVDREADRIEIERVGGDHGAYEAGLSFPLSETFCASAVEADGQVCVLDPAEGEDARRVYDEFGFETYLGTVLGVEGDRDRVFFFMSEDAREAAFSDAERTFLDLMGQWIEYEIERRRHETDLEETIERLEQSNDRLKQFAYAASHDLQEPLRMVSSYLQLLEDQYRDELDETAEEYIDFAVDGADRMRAMVDDLLAYSRVEQADGEFEPVDCEAVLDRVTDDLQVRIEETDADVVVDSLPRVRGDAEQLEQLFSNLVANAVKYNESDRPRVEVTAERRGDYCELAVSDNGIGIDPEKADRIFEVFKRLHHDDEYTGTGIGLSLCQEIVDNHGGDVSVDSEPGEGSTFTVTLPAAGDRDA